MKQIMAAFFIAIGSIIAARSIHASEYHVEEAEGSFYLNDRYMIYYTGNGKVHETNFYLILIRGDEEIN